jgi:hypothetical protein
LATILSHGQTFGGSYLPAYTVEARALTFGGKEGSMLGRIGWFDARSYCWFDRVGFDDISKSWVLCGVEVCDSMHNYKTYTLKL